MPKKLKLKKELIEALFENHDHQSEILVAIYKMVFPDFDRIEKVDGWPKISKEANEFFFDKFIDFDQKHHPNVMAGGLWMNNGFSSNEAGGEPVEGWDVSLENVNIIYKPETLEEMCYEKIK